MRIVMLAPIKRPITADTTVSRNRVIVDLASGLTERGYKVTIIGTADSNVPNTDIIGVVPKGLNFLPAAENPFYQHTSYLTQMIKTLVDRQNEFDLAHNHMYPEFLPLLALSSLKIPLITTVHAQMTNELSQALAQFPQAKLVAISEAAKKASGLPMTVIHNSVDTDFFIPREQMESFYSSNDPDLIGGVEKLRSNSSRQARTIINERDYFLFVGRLSSAKDKEGNFLDPKGVQNAIKVSHVTGERLKIVGNVEDMKFFDELVKPHLSDKIEFVGEVSPEQKLTREQMRDLFTNAKCLLNPINWEEPFGLVMIEALSCGTPVIAFNRGAVSEILVDGKTGFVIDPHSGIDGLVDAVGKIDLIDRKTCRDHAVAHFSKKRMVEDYERLYYSLLK